MSALAGAGPLRVDGPPLLGDRLRRPAAVVLTITVIFAAVLGAASAIKPAAGALIVIGALGTLFLVQRPRLSVYLMVLVAPSCAGLSRGLLIPGLRVSEVAIAGLGLLVLVFARDVDRPRWTGVEQLLLLYAIATVLFGSIDLVSRHAPLNNEELGQMLGPFQFVILLRVVVAALRTERQRYLAAVAMLAAATVVGLIALAQFADLGPTRSVLESVAGGGLYEKSLEEGIGRVTGPFAIWHELAGFLMPCILLSLALLLDSSSPRRRIALGFAFVVMFAALLSTGTIGIAGATVLGILYLTWKRGVLHIAVGLAIPAIVAVLLVFGSSINERSEQQYGQNAASYNAPLVPQSLAYRYMLFRDQNAPALAGRWATGFGPDLPPQLALGNFPYAQTTYILLLMRGGVPLLAVFLLLTAAVLRASWTAQRRARTDLQWSIATVALLSSVFYVLLQLIESYLVDSGPPQAYWVVIGLMIAAAGRSSAEQASAEAPSRPRMARSEMEP